MLFRSLRNNASMTAITEAEYPKLKTAIGNDFRRTARFHYMPEGSSELPAIATMLGPRIVPDSAAFRPLTHSEVPGRHMLSAADVAYTLGVDRARAYLAGDLKQYPNLEKHLDASRRMMDQKGDDLYSLWLAALRGAAKRPFGVVPTFMATTAYDDFRMNTVVAGYGHLRHNYVLIAAQSYSEGGCEIPDGYVEPATSTYTELLAYAARGKKVMEHLNVTRGAKYFRELSSVLSVLRAISEHELEGRALTSDEKAFLSMVAEMNHGSTGSAPSYTGWYFDAFYGRSETALKHAGFVADYFTSGYGNGAVAYVGGRAPSLGIFVIDVGGVPRVAVGPVADAYELTGDLDKRLTDETAPTATGKRSPWSESYTSKFPPAFAVVGALASTRAPSGEDSNAILTLAFKHQPKNLVVELLDHHRHVIERKNQTVRGTRALVQFRTQESKVSGIRVRVGESIAEEFRGIDGVYMRVGDWPQDFQLGQTPAQPTEGRRAR